jgi:hypothetical protein
MPPFPEKEEMISSLAQGVTWTWTDLRAASFHFTGMQHLAQGIKHRQLLEKDGVSHILERTWNFFDRGRLETTQTMKYHS